MSESPVRWFGPEEIDVLLDAAAVVESQRQAFVALEDGSGQLAERLLLPNAADQSTAFCYAARLSPETGPVCKFGSVNPANADAGLPSVSATVLVLDPVTGRPRALMDGEALTTARTAAASALAARSLAVPSASTLAVLGAGVQAAAHVRALAGVLPLEVVRLHSRSPDRAASTADRLAEETGLQVRAVDSARKAVEGAAVVVTATTSRTPVLEASWLAPGCLVVTVGSFAPDRVEVGEDVVRRSDVLVVDHVPTAAAQSGALVNALAGGALRVDELAGLGAVLLGASPGRRSAEDVVLYTSVGLGIQDAAVAWLVLQAADG